MSTRDPVSESSMRRSQLPTFVDIPIECEETSPSRSSSGPSLFRGRGWASEEG